MIIQIEHSVSDEVLKKIRTLLKQESMNNVNFSGVKFRIHRGDHTCIPKDDSLAACKLFYSIVDLIESSKYSNRQS